MANCGLRICGSRVEARYALPFQEEKTGDYLGHDNFSRLKGFLERVFEWQRP